MENIATQEARRMVESSRAGELTVLDVRQPGEYERFHLPGALLIPLSELLGRKGEVPQDRPVLVYCHSGGRSSAAAALLDGDGREQVYNLLGGSMSWTGGVALGPLESGLEHLGSVRSCPELLLAAFGMEAFLQQFYIRMRDTAAMAQGAETFDRLAGFEDVHKNSLYARYAKEESSPLARPEFEAAAEAAVGEGGVDPDAFIAEHAAALATPMDVVSVAMMFEAQALDLYMRASRKQDFKELHELLLALAREEQAHLKVLAAFMDQLAS